MSVDNDEGAMADRAVVLDLDQGMKPVQQVSIIVRSMARDTLAATLASIAASDYRPLQIVLVNARGGYIQAPVLPTDNLELKLANQGGEALERSAAANLGLTCSSGSLALFLDDDDLIDPDHICRLASCLIENPEAVAAYTGVRLVDHSGATIREQNEIWEPDRLQGMNFLPIHAVMFRLYSVLGHASFDTRLPLMEDWDFWCQLARLGKFVHLVGCSATYNVGLGQSGLSENRDISSMLNAHAQVLERLRQRDPLAPSRALFWFDTALAHVQREKQQEADNLASANRYIADLEQRVRHEESDNAMLQLTQQQLRLTESRYQAELDNLRQLQLDTAQQLAAANQQLQILDERQNQLEKELHMKNSELAIADAALAHVLASRSWQLTAPLRTLAQALQNLVKH